MVKGAGHELSYAYGLSDSTKRGKYIFCARGGGVAGIDRLDITTDKWMLFPDISTETLNTGSNFAYDGGDRLYFTKDATQRLYYLDLLTHSVHGAGKVVYDAPVAVANRGNCMEIFTTADGLKYIWISRSSFTECFKQLISY